MARSYLAAALAVSTLATIVVFHLITSFGVPQSTYLDTEYTGLRTEDVPGQIPFNVEKGPTAFAEDGTKYFLGVGKADITGYLSPKHRCRSDSADQVLGRSLK